MTVLLNGLEDCPSMSEVDRHGLNHDAQGALLESKSPCLRLQLGHGERNRPAPPSNKQGGLRRVCLVLRR